MRAYTLLASFVLSLWFPFVGFANGTPSCDELAQIAQNIQGFVFEDRNRNGKQDSGEPGVAGVSVSNGCDVAVTDSEGFYQTRLAAEQILFVSQPSGYLVPVDENNLPQFYYKHYPEGSPKRIDGESVAWKFPVIEPTGRLPGSIDFPIYKQDASESVFAAHGFADTQAKTEIDQDMLREDLVNTLWGNPYGAAFTITVGDVVFDNLALYDRHKEMLALIDTPNWNLPGNHDLNFESPNSHYAVETYKKHFGPPYYSFNYGQVHVVALNNVEYSGTRGVAAGKTKYRGYLFTFDHHNVVPEFIPFPYGRDAVQRMRIMLEPDLNLANGDSIHRGHWHPGTKVVVNLFDGGPRDKLSLSLDGAAPQPMRYVIRADPFAEHFRSSFPEYYGDKTHPEKSAHIWEYELPNDLESGIHSLEVESLDEFSQQRRGVFTFEVIK